MSTNDFLPFGTDPSAHVIDQATYLAAAFRALGFSNGIAVAEQLNKVWRQSSFVSAALAQFVSNQTGTDVLDNGDLAAFIAKLNSAVVIGAGIKPVRVITASAALPILLTDYRVALKRTVSVAAFNATLPAGATVGQSVKIGDVIGNLNAAPVTVLPQGGQNIANAASFLMNQDKMWAEFALVDATTWSVEL